MVWRCLCDPVFSHGRTLTCERHAYGWTDRQRDRQTRAIVYTVLAQHCMQCMVKINYMHRVQTRSCFIISSSAAVGHGTSSSSPLESDTASMDAKRFLLFPTKIQRQVNLQNKADLRWPVSATNFFF